MSADPHLNPCPNSPTKEHALSAHEGARTKSCVGKACVWCGKHEDVLRAEPPIPSLPSPSFTAEEVAAVARSLQDSRYWCSLDIQERVLQTLRQATPSEPQEKK